MTHVPEITGYAREELMGKVLRKSLTNAEMRAEIKKQHRA